VVAGSGPTLPIARLIARAYEERHAGITVVVPGSIGSGGAIAALKDGAIDAGLLSRPPFGSELPPGFAAKPFAQIPFSVVVHEKTAVSSLGRGGLADIFRGITGNWPDGTPIVPLVRERGDSGSILLASSFPELAAAIDDSLRTGRFTVCYSDAEMRDALLEIPGAVGFLDAATIAIEKLPLKTVSLDGAAPGPVGRYPFDRTYYLVFDDPPRNPHGKAFVEFALSAEARTLLSEYGVEGPLAGNGRD
jgi:phosphate transport system substrate-binding protein